MKVMMVQSYFVSHKPYFKIYFTFAQSGKDKAPISVTDGAFISTLDLNSSQGQWLFRFYVQNLSLYFSITRMLSHGHQKKMKKSQDKK